MVTSFIGDVIPDTLLKVLLNTNKLVTMFYVIADTLLKVALNTNRTGQHVLRDQFYWCLMPLSTMLVIA
jgi:hypothetical protein